MDKSQLLVKFQVAHFGAMNSSTSGLVLRAHDPDDRGLPAFVYLEWVAC
jgi:hypothetical protein